MNLSPKERILVALDYDNADDALRLVRSLAGQVGGFKIGLELVNAAGFDLFAQARDAGAERIFYDAKFHDIPHTVAGAVRAAARRGIWMVNVHASGGRAMLEAARDGAHGADAPPLLIGVTVLTSIDEATLRHDLRVPGTPAEHALHLACLAQESGLDGIVASPHEVSAIRAHCGERFISVIPGIRPAGADAHDQKRVATPAQAVREGARYLVIGRAITRAKDPVAAARSIVREIEEA